MRYKIIGHIIGLLFIFFKRSVLNFGILKNKLFRVIMTIGIVLVTVIMTTLLYKMLNDNKAYDELTNSLLDIYSLTTFMWTFIVFMFIKILFKKKDSFIKFATSMPVSRGEKNIAIVIFEIIISLIIVYIIGLSVVIAFIMKNGIMVLPRILCNVTFTCTTAYLILELLYRLVGWLVCVFEMYRLKDTILTCLFLSIFMFIYSVVFKVLTDGILFNYMDNKGTSPIAVYSYIMDNTHFIVSAYLFLAINIALLVVICIIPDEDLDKVRNCVHLKYNIEKISLIKKMIGKNRIFTAYLVNVSRRIDTLDLDILVVFTYIMSLVIKLKSPEYAVVILTMNGLYMCVQTENIRRLMYQKYYDLVKDYMYMLGSQLLYMCIVSIPFMVMSFIRGNGIKDIVFLYLIMLVITIFTTFIGIVFVPKRENPISIMVGFFTMIIIAMILSFAIIIFQINLSIIIPIIVILCVIVIYYSLIGLVSLKKESSYGV